MARKLVQVCLLLTMLLGPTAGALAAACPHAGCMTAAAAHVETDDDERGRHQATHEEHPGHVAAHDAAPPARAQTHHDAAPPRGVAANPHEPDCAHCAGDDGVPPASSFKWQIRPADARGESAAPRPVEQVSLPVVLPAREFAPTQHAPPGRTDRHILFQVFRI